MSWRFSVYIVTIGLAAALVMMVPGVVLLGLILGVVPGLILALAPSLFCYSVVWYGTRALLLHAAVRAGISKGARLFRSIAGLAALAIIALPAVLVPLAINAPIEGEIAALRAEDRTDATPLSLPPVVAIEVPPYWSDSREQLYCETLCQRLLYNGAAQRVIVAESPQPGRSARLAPTAYFIERRESCPTPALSLREIVWPGDFAKRRGGRHDSVRVRVQAGECLIGERGRVEEAGVIISYRTVKAGWWALDRQWAITLDTVTAHRLEVVEAGRVRYRRTEVTAEPLSVPLMIQTRAGLLTTVTYVGWARTKKTIAPIGPNGRDVLPSLLGEAGRPPDLPGAM